VYENAKKLSISGREGRLRPIHARAARPILRLFNKLSVAKWLVMIPAGIRRFPILPEPLAVTASNRSRFAKCVSAVASRAKPAF
jgi:hypothetical protein